MLQVTNETTAKSYKTIVEYDVPMTFNYALTVEMIRSKRYTDVYMIFRK
jgi:hypothetical protein